MCIKQHSDRSNHYETLDTDRTTCLESLSKKKKKTGNQTKIGQMYELLYFTAKLCSESFH